MKKDLLKIKKIICQQLKILQYIQQLLLLINLQLQHLKRQFQQGFDHNEIFCCLSIDVNLLKMHVLDLREFYLNNRQYQCKQLLLVLQQIMEKLVVVLITHVNVDHELIGFVLLGLNQKRIEQIKKKCFVYFLIFALIKIRAKTIYIKNLNSKNELV